MPIPFDVTRNPIYLGKLAAKEVIADVCSGRRSIAMLCGGSGIGKTYDVRQIARRHLIKEVPEERPATTEALVALTWKNRHLPLHVYNECDHLFTNVQSINLIKIMHEEPRRCVFSSKEALRNEMFKAHNSLQYRAEIAPTSFDLGRLSRQLYTGNTNFQDEAVTSRLADEHWTALLRRGLDPVWIPTDGRDGLDLFEITYWMATEDNLLRNHGHTYDTAQRAIRFYIDNIHKLPEITPGRLLLIATIIRDSSDNKLRCEARLHQMLRAEDQRPKLKLESGFAQVLYWPKKPLTPKRKRYAQRNQPQRPTRQPPPPPVNRPLLLPPPLVVPVPPPIITPAPLVGKARHMSDPDQRFRQCRRRLVGPDSRSIDSRH